MASSSGIPVSCCKFDVSGGPHNLGPLPIYPKGEAKLILELGSGVSTIIAAHGLRRVGGGTIISLDHEQRLSQETARSLLSYGLKDLATVLHAPLTKVDLGQRSFAWFDLQVIADVDQCRHAHRGRSFWHIQQLSRYPALPLLKDRLNPGAIILLDDAARKDEKEILPLWSQEFPDLSLEAFDTVKGTAILTLTSSQAVAGAEEAVR